MNYDINPISSNIFFSIGQPIMIILLVLTAISGLLTFIGHTTSLNNLDYLASKWFSRFIVATLCAGLIWLGLSMIISYAGNSILDVVNGVIILSCVVISLVKRATSDQVGANRALIFAYVFLTVILIWGFIYNAINVPEEVTEAVGNTFKPQFFSDVFRLWHWII